MHKLAFTLIALMLLSPVVNAAVKWNNAGGEDKEPKTSKVQVPVSVFELKRNFSKIYCQMTAAKTVFAFKNMASTDVIAGLDGEATIAARQHARTVALVTVIV